MCELERVLIVTPAPVRALAAAFALTFAQVLACAHVRMLDVELALELGDELEDALEDEHIHEPEDEQKVANAHERALARALMRALWRALADALKHAFEHAFEQVFVGVGELGMAVTVKAAVKGTGEGEGMLAFALARVRAFARARAHAFALEHVRAFALKPARAFVLKRALENARVLEVAFETELESLLLHEHERALKYNLDQRYSSVYKALADLKLKDILYSVETDRHYQLARNLWVHSVRYDQSLQSQHKYSTALHVIAPIARLPLELLQYIFLITIDETSDSPFVLMRVCKHWYAMVTGIWALLNLGTRTAKDAVTTRLERNQWLLDILVDTEIDRGDLPPSASEGAYEAIFAAIEVASRWRSVVVKTFPGQADLPEDLVNRGLQRCSGATMSRLRTFKIKCACEMSPLLDHLLRILGTTASAELTTIEINSANVI